MTLFYNSKPLLLLVFLHLSLLTAPLFAAEISVSVDRNPVNLKESFQITFTANDETDDDPDFSPLDKDFDILNQSQQQSVQIINWKKTKSIQWVLTVMAKRSGNLVIPAINFGQDSSQYTAILVNDAQVASAENEDLFLQVEVNTTEPYVQEQLIYTLKLYRKVNITQAALTDPVLKDAVIERLGEDNSYNAQFQGENYVVTERKYAIFPQKSGAMRIAPLTLTADIIIPGQRRTNSFFNTQSTRVKRVASKEIDLEVQAKPADAGDIWLPAKRVLLQENWSENAAQMTVGQPVTRTIRLTVEGQTASGLPELFNKNLPEHLKAYPDQPVLQEKANKEGMIAFREEKIALIPGQAGTYILPAVEIPWWNTNTGKMETAILPQRTITAIVASGSSTKQVDQPAAPALVPELSTVKQDKLESAEGDNKLWIGLTIFFACGWAVTLWLLLTRKARTPAKELKNNVNEAAPAAVKLLKKSCIKNDPVLAKDALVQWGRNTYAQSSLTQIAGQCSEPLQNEILLLNDALYSPNVVNWQGNDLWTAFQNNKSINSVNNSEVDPLPPLFKI